MSTNAQPNQTQNQSQVQVMKVVKTNWKKFSGKQKTWILAPFFLLLLVSLISSFLLWSKTDKQEALLAENAQLKEEVRGLKNLAAVQKQPSASSEGGLSLTQVKDAVGEAVNASCGPKAKEPEVAKAAPVSAKKKVIVKKSPETQVVKKVSPPAVVSQQALPVVAPASAAVCENCSQKGHVSYVSPLTGSKVTQEVANAQEALKWLVSQEALCTAELQKKQGMAGKSCTNLHLTERRVP